MVLILSILISILAVTFQQKIFQETNCQIKFQSQIQSNYPFDSSCQTACLVCTAQNKCQACIVGYTLNPALSICQLNNSCNQPVCWSCVNQICQMCNSGFVLDPNSFQCKKCPSKCAVCDLQGNCIDCQVSYFFNQNKNCQRCIFLECLECFNNISCSRCGYGTYVGSSIPSCLNCISDCEYCTNGNSCIVCNEGYFLSNSKCSPCSSSCVQCNGTSTNCTACSIYSFISNNTCVPCFSLVPFCVVCTLANPGSIKCLNCVLGMFISPQNTCQPCPLSCSTCTNFTTCVSCISAYYISKSTCLPCNIPYCTQCINNNTCTSCTFGYFSIKNSTMCEACSFQCSTCLNYQKCKQCFYGYTLVNGTCIQNPINCLKAVSSTICALCNQGFFMMDNKPDKLCLPCPLYCNDCQAEYYCNGCSPGYYQVNYVCQKCIIDNCFNCLHSNGSNACGLCNEGYYLTQNNLNCQNCPTNCLICNNSNSCLKCTDGYYESLSEGNCTVCPQSCLQCIDGKKCLVCAQGFFISSNYTQCQKCLTGCNQCIWYGSCLKCSQGYYFALINNYQICQKCVYPCLKCKSSDICTICGAKFIVTQNGQCQPCPDGCLKCDSLNYCFECQQGYALKYIQHTFLCKPCSPGCKKCSYLQQINQTTTKCYQCQYGLLLLSNGFCISCGTTSTTQGCQTCNQNGTCLKCTEQFILNSKNQCINNNYQYQNQTQSLQIASIILGCITAILLIITLYIKFTKSNIYARNP